jgi:hypothetical protein
MAALKTKSKLLIGLLSSMLIIAATVSVYYAFSLRKHTGTADQGGKALRTAPRESFFYDARQYRPKLSKSYSQRLPLKAQMTFLRKSAQEGDATSACILARAISVCREMKEDLDYYEDDISDNYSTQYLISMSDEEIKSIADNKSLREDISFPMCKEMTEFDLSDYDQIIFNAASHGDPVSMRTFALQSDKQTKFGDPVPVSKQLVHKHRQHAESMLNRAAEAGDSVAIQSVYASYATGGISTPFGEIEVRRDKVKAIAAYLALVAVDDFRLKSTTTSQDSAETEDWIRSNVAGLNQADQSRLSRLRDQYIRAYNSKQRPKNIGDTLLDDLPEHVCQ